MRIFLTLLIPLIITLSCKYDKGSYFNYDKELPTLISNLNINPDDIFVLIDKSEYKLTLRTDSIVIKEYPVVFGGNPVDDKLMEGDGCTPEGSFLIRSKYPHKKWSKFLWLNYPTDDSREKHNEAKRKGKIPLNASIGGEVGIHGVPEKMDMLIGIKQNWTLGCISLKNKDVNEIYNYILPNKTLITIQK
ncbi:MAG: L,D-transpeptidase [Bacteroidales bacterium]|nr:L,D-transpeptidase [Bacteroidales bacterium]